MMVKSTPFDVQNKLFSFIDDSRGSKFIKTSTFTNLLLNYNYRSKNGDKKLKTLNINGKSLIEVFEPIICRLLSYFWTYLYITGCLFFV